MEVSRVSSVANSDRSLKFCHFDSFVKVFRMHTYFNYKEFP